MQWMLRPIIKIIKLLHTQQIINMQFSVCAMFQKVQRVHRNISLQQLTLITHWQHNSTHWCKLFNYSVSADQTSEQIATWKWLLRFHLKLNGACLYILRNLTLLGHYHVVTSNLYWKFHATAFKKMNAWGWFSLYDNLAAYNVSVDLQPPQNISVPTAAIEYLGYKYIILEHNSFHPTTLLQECTHSIYGKHCQTTFTSFIPREFRKT